MTDLNTIADNLEQQALQACRNIAVEPGEILEMSPDFYEHQIEYAARRFTVAAALRAMESDDDNGRR